MPAVIDYPQSERPVAPARFNVRGWLWLEERHGEVAAVEACCGDQCLGRAWNLQDRPDVTQALNLPKGTRTGFDFFADYVEEWTPEFDLSVRAVFKDGSRSGPLVSKKVALQPLQARGSEASAVSLTARSPASPAQRSGHDSTHDVLPPDHLQIRQVGGVWGPLFFSEGKIILDQIASAAEEGGLPLGSAKRVLDFGCGCGRVLKNVHEVVDSACEVWGCDIDAEAIAWCRGHLKGSFSANPHLPPTEFPMGFFDIVYSVSVFTHLPEELQFAWLCELRRVLKPGGIAVISVHGEHYWHNGADDVREEIATRGFAYRTGAVTEGLPDFYMVAYHAEEYIRTRWTWFFDVLQIKRKYIHGLHDAVIVRRRAD